MNQTNNILLSTDSYKISHYKQYPKGTELAGLPANSGTKE